MQRNEKELSYDQGDREAKNLTRDEEALYEDRAERLKWL